VTPGRAARAERHDWHRTQAGGLLFLLQPLRRLGIAEALTTGAALPADLAARVLASVAARAGVDAEDPVWSILQVQADESSPVPFGDGYVGGAGYAVHVWVAALRRWCRQHAGVGLRALVRRSAHVRWTGAHVDVQFDPNSVDVRLRRAGLDVDPGWTPWFGRVVRFHYDGRP
jgi:hypothetical protein